LIRRIPYEQAYEAGFEDMHRRIPCLDRIRELIGYQPTKTLDQMLQAIIDDQKVQATATQSIDEIVSRHEVQPSI
jgi:UDP-glucose 4-epimerase